LRWWKHPGEQYHKRRDRDTNIYLAILPNRDRKLVSDIKWDAGRSNIY
jgi:hypothetical protein